VSCSSSEADAPTTMDVAHAFLRLFPDPRPVNDWANLQPACVTFLVLVQLEGDDAVGDTSIPGTRILVLADDELDVWCYTPPAEPAVIGPLFAAAVQYVACINTAEDAGTARWPINAFCEDESSPVTGCVSSRTYHLFYHAHTFRPAPCASAAALAL
jgi:hypothetical protein